MTATTGGHLLVLGPLRVFPKEYECLAAKLRRHEANVVPFAGFKSDFFAGSK